MPSVVPRRIARPTEIPTEAASEAISSLSARCIGFAASAFLLFMSGTAALIFQVLWVKQLSLVVGSDVHAVTIVLSAFFAGLAIGNCGFGRLADRLSHPLILYGILELGAGALGVPRLLF